jgi:hypothetical protein
LVCMNKRDRKEREIMKERWELERVAIF